MNWLRYALITLAVVSMASFGLLEVRDRQRYVTETDARITAHLVTVSSRVSGWLTAVAVREGDEVAFGQIIATVDDRESNLRVRQLQARRQALSAEGDQIDAERVLVDQRTRRRYDTQQSKLTAANASVSALDAPLQLARSELARATSLFEKRVISRQELDQNQATASQLAGEHRMAMAELEESQALLEEVQAERARLSVLDRARDRINHLVNELELELEQQRLDLTDRTIKSPVQGVVGRTFVALGEYVTPGQRIAIVHDPQTRWVEANIKETQVARLAQGQVVHVSVDAYPSLALRGRVESIGHTTTSSYALLPKPNPSGNFTKITQRIPVRIGVELPKSESDPRRGLESYLRPGMMVEVKIDVASRP